MKVIVNFLTLVSLNLILFFVGMFAASSAGIITSQDMSLMKGYAVIYFVFIGLPTFVVFLKKTFITKKVA